MPYDRMPREDSERQPDGLRIFRAESGSLLFIQATRRKASFTFFERIYCILSAVKLIWRITNFRRL